MYWIAALYEFKNLTHPKKTAERIEMACQDLLGTLILAEEGINGTIAGSKEKIDALIEKLQALGFQNLEIKYSHAQHAPFHRMKVLVKKEIVTLGHPLNEGTPRGTYVRPEDWNQLMDEGVLLIDTRNDYEVQIGSFEDAINPLIKTFRDFPEFVKENLDPQKQQRIAMFCTGGIRCEKSTAFLKQQGFREVYHLQGGILAYLEQVPKPLNRWQGECFVFDQRTAVGVGLKTSNYTFCRTCRRPLSAQDQQHPDHREGVHCQYCAHHISERSKQRAEERHRQMLLAAQRGKKHLGARMHEP